MADRTPEPADDAGTEALPPPHRSWRMLAVVGPVATLLVALVVACAIWIPTALYPSMSATDLSGLSDPQKVQAKAERLKLQNDARTTFFQGLAALLVLGGASLGAYMTLRQVRATRAQITETAKASANQLKVSTDQLRLSEQGQVTDRYTKAIDQLGEDALAVRLGGLYALERIARDSPGDRATIAEVLCAYVRTAPRDPPGRGARAAEPPNSASSTETSSTANPSSSLAVRAPDVQAALTILGRWQRRMGDPPLDLDLHEAEIQGADLYGAQLQGAYLAEAQLQDANLMSAQLQDANLREARLEGAILVGAQLQGAHFIGARLGSAVLSSALMKKAYLGGAQLQGAILIGAVATEETRWPDGWDQARLAAEGVRFEGKREGDGGSTGDSAQLGKEQDSSGR